MASEARSGKCVGSLQLWSLRLAVVQAPSRRVGGSWGGGLGRGEGERRGGWCGGAAVRGEEGRFVAQRGRDGSAEVGGGKRTDPA